MIAAAKAATGIAGFDEITGGGLPRERTTLLMGGPGSGKTIFSLQFLAHGAQVAKEPGIFVAFEESAERIIANAESFGWNLGKLRSKRLYFLDAQPPADLVQTGDFDLCAMLSGLAIQAADMGAHRIVFDALDIVMALLPDAAARRREIYRLHEWLLERGLTGLITLKSGDDEAAEKGGKFHFMQFMVDCAVILDHSVVAGASQRTLRVQKYRGSSFDENESPFLIGSGGFEVDVVRPQGRADVDVTTERISSGVDRLDTMLDGGYYRGASILITGYSGTAKTTLSGAFAEAACARGERTMFVSFDSDCGEVVRNLASVDIRLARHVKNGRLRMVSARSIAGSAENYLVRIKTLAREHRARCLVIDPVSTWYKSGADLSTYSADGEVLRGTLRWAKERSAAAEAEANEATAELGRVKLDAEEAELEVRMKALQVELVAKKLEKALLARTTRGHESELSRGRQRMRELRGADPAKAVPK